MNYVDCTGGEASLLECRYQEAKANECDEFDAAGVRCEGYTGRCQVIILINNETQVPPTTP